MKIVLKTIAEGSIYYTAFHKGRLHYIERNNGVYNVLKRHLKREDSKVTILSEDELDALLPDIKRGELEVLFSKDEVSARNSYMGALKKLNKE